MREHGGSSPLSGTILERDMYLTEIDKHNMKYLGLDEEQYVIHKKLMRIPMKDWPTELTNYVKTTHGKDAICGDAIACWVAEWVRQGGILPQPVPTGRVLRFD